MAKNARLVINAKRITRLRVREVSLVDRAANGEEEPIMLKRRAEQNTDVMDMLKNATKQPQQKSSKTYSYDTDTVTRLLATKTTS